MDISPPQIVPSEYCLSCRGCCLFSEEKGPWAVRLTFSEKDIFERKGAACRVSTGMVLKTELHEENYRCVCLDFPTHHCQLYSNRPFECQLYPFLLSSESNSFKLYVHTKCPFVEQERQKPAWNDCLQKIKNFFADKGVLNFVMQEGYVFADYSTYTDVELVSEIQPFETLSYRGVIENALRDSSQEISAQSFVDILSWEGFFDYDFETINGQLCVFANQNVGTFMYWPPLGEGDMQRTIDECFCLMRKKNQGGSLTRIDHVSLKDLQKVDVSAYDVRLQGHEYVYCRSDIEALSGDAYKSKRHELNVLARNCALEYRAFQEEDRQGCFELLEEWLDQKRQMSEDGIAKIMLDEARVVHKRLISYANTLKLLGRVVLQEKRIVGYTFGHTLNENTFCNILEVCDPTIDGLATFIFHQLCNDEAVKSLHFINVTDDFCLPNIEQAKLSYRPVFLQPVYAIRDKGC